MDIDARDQELREAIMSRDVTSVRRLLAAGTPLDHRVAGATPLHFCLSNYCWKVNRDVLLPLRNNREKEIEIIRELVAKAKDYRGVLDSPDDGGESPLYEATDAGDLETVQLLVCAGANVNNINREAETVLHVAARAIQHHVLKYFLDNHAVENSYNKHNYTPMHFAAISGEVESMKLLLQKFGGDQLTKRNYQGRTVWHEIAAWNAIETAQYLLQDEDCKYRSDLNLVDNDHKTPLYLAARQGNAEMTALLLRNGAALSARRATETAIKAIAKEFTNPLTFLEEIFDDCVYEKKESIKVDYKVLTDSNGDGKGMSQIKVIEELVRWGQSNLLKHPLLESLIYLKWKCLLPVFYIIVATYATFLGTFTLFVVTTFNKIDTYNRTLNESSPETDVPFVESCGRRYWTLVVFIYLSIGVLFFQECVWIRLRKFRYLEHREPWVKLFGLVLAALVPALVNCAPPAPAPAPWQRYVACAALLLAWLQAMLLLSRFPGWGYYVLMFEKVALNVMKVLMTSVCLVIGFSVCFMILYQSQSPFDGFAAAFVKTLVMMLSEFDYEDLFDDEHTELEDTKPVVRLLFVMFVIFIAIVLMNFMIGVAVIDLNELNAIGNVRRLEKQVELLSTLEGLGDTVLGRWWRRLSHIRFHSDMGRRSTAEGRRWIVYPNQYNRDTEYFQQTFPSELHNAINNVARKKKQDVNKLDVLYDAVVEVQHDSKHHPATRSDDQVPPATLKDRIKSIEELNKEIQQSIDYLKKASDDNRSTEEIKESIDELRKGMNVILRIVAQLGPRTRPGYLVAGKVVSRKRKLKQKRKKYI